ncbi:MAG: hypothetical protein ABFS41_06385 [Myxococcota bacterium]
MDWVDPDKIPPELWKQMNITKEAFAEAMAQMMEREKHVPQVGDPAPDFALRRLGPDRKPTDGRVQLSELRGRPVALVFGSYT